MAAAAQAVAEIVAVEAAGVGDDDAIGFAFAQLVAQVRRPASSMNSRNALVSAGTGHGSAIGKW